MAKIGDQTVGGFPATYEEIYSEWVAKNKPSEFNLALNTVGRVVDGGVGFDIYYHGNLIVSLTMNTITYSCRGWDTYTTKQRINRFLEAKRVGYLNHSRKVFYGHDGQVLDPFDTVTVDLVG